MITSIEQSPGMVLVSRKTKLLEEISYVKHRDSPLISAVVEAMQSALHGKTSLPSEVISMTGMSGVRYRIFINNCVKLVSNPSYLEVGSWAGSTLCSAICGNSVVAMAIDNWSEFEDQVKFSLPKYQNISPRVSN